MRSIIGVSCEQNQQSISASTHSHPASPHSVPCNPPQFMPSVNKHVVAPLNLSTTVEGSLVGLRESLVTLSEALESQGRRQELALTTEGLRVSEEVGSLKAVVQGLRMQVSLRNRFFGCHLSLYGPGIYYSGVTLLICLGAPDRGCGFILRPYTRSVSGQQFLHAACADFSVFPHNHIYSSRTGSP